MAATTALTLADLTNLFDLLSDETRLHLVFLLAKGDCNVSSLCEELKLSQPKVSHHLGLLRMNGMVAARRMHHQVFYSLAENFRFVGGKLRISLPTAMVTIEGL